MAKREAGDVTALLLQWRRGDKAALDALLPLIYRQLRLVAHARLRAEGDGNPLQTTELVHEVYLRLIDIDRLSFNDRTHFFAVSARLMRQILVDRARRDRAAKRGGGAALLSLEGMPLAVTTNTVDVLALDQALDELAGLEERLCRVVELKFFAGLSIAETAVALDVSPATVERDWSVAKAWLYDRLST